MQGYIKFEAKEYGLEVECHIKDVSFMDKVMFLNGMMNALDIDMDNNNEVGMYCALAATIANKAATTIAVDKNMLNVLKDLKEKHEREAGEG